MKTPDQNTPNYGNLLARHTRGEELTPEEKGTVDELLSQGNALLEKDKERNQSLNTPAVKRAGKFARRYKGTDIDSEQEK